MPGNAENEKQILFNSIRLMICVGHADGYMGEKEIGRVYRMVESERFTLRERQVLMDDIDNPKRPDQLVQDMADLTRTEKLRLLRQLYHVAVADRKITPAEQQEIRRIAGLLGIEQDKLQQVEDWILEGIDWKERWQKIVGE
ncbi:TerB family tellurite resistance protein [Brevibacillus humidisoli]|uniref:tellurite resistance TerB family protein n=1 Tax=Brevibacillus humidisoli TaxID=2895522 RepID=UPI001E2AC8C9|nr:TerB family tellurite resistance protein [Brevibacillus humidisoli]UFJ41675.1 TerB family tellurite resistance protein [Brevibacillus humidisoli]